ncbi:uncharacterized protein SPAR_I00280 [Saccharomyces paradoxus]|uniref:Uncharacterized protein n=1 Tax=Saccharomyces paradoxus TaxID=27291 RepID=A0A8B8UT58_SACPA|nr:uncharacterized protein SPAR_I00280 [Saccharomyces paradoxus]QHS73881.1 hypothetical protein SPAR_I00280 [Saccharomyces paradoxus]
MFPLRAVLEPCVKNVIIPIAEIVKDSISTTSKLLAEETYSSYSSYSSHSLTSSTVLIGTTTTTAASRKELLPNRKIISSSKQSPASNIYAY